MFNFLRRKKSDRISTAIIAKERLQIIVAHERVSRNNSDFLPKLQRELLEVIQKYVSVDPKKVQISFENEDNCSVLELNVTLPSP